MAHPTLAERQALCAAKVTLDGQPAKVSGFRNEYAKVSIIKSGLSAEWAWETVARIVAKGGRFSS
jgi:hypothetical protein